MLGSRSPVVQIPISTTVTQVVPELAGILDTFQTALGLAGDRTDRIDSGKVLAGLEMAFSYLASFVSCRLLGTFVGEA